MNATIGGREDGTALADLKVGTTTAVAPLT